MANDPPLSLQQKFAWAWKMFQAARAETKGNFGRAIRLLDEASAVKTLWPPERVQRAMLLLKDEQVNESHRNFVVLRSEFKGSDDPDLQYLWRFCTAMIDMIAHRSGRFFLEAELAQKIKCNPRLKRRFAMVTYDEVHERKKSLL
jgi:hypothetical protein